MTFAVGDKVRLSTEHTPINVGPAYKLCARFAGPFKITKKINDVAFKLELPRDWKIHPVFHVSNLQPFHETETFTGRPAAPRMNTRQETRMQRGVWEIEDVLATRTIKNRNGSRSTQYLIKWEGYPPEKNSWEPWHNLNALGKKFVKSKKL